MSKTAMMMRTFVAASATLLGACGGKQAPSPTTSAQEIKLYTLDCGRGTTTKAGMFADDGAYDGQSADFVVPCFLIRHPSGDLLWNTGLPDAWADKNPGQQGSMTFEVRHKLKDQLAELGLTPADIELLTVSHSHDDHFGNVTMFPASTWIVDADERADLFSAEARENKERFAEYAALENIKTRLIEGADDLDVFGDGKVMIIQTPGHTVGHTSLLVRLAETGAVFLTGDLYHRPENREHRRVPRHNSSREQTVASMDKFERIANETNARVVIEHAPGDFAALPVFPKFLR